MDRGGSILMGRQLICGHVGGNEKIDALMEMVTNDSGCNETVSTRGPLSEWWVLVKKDWIFFL